MSRLRIERRRHAQRLHATRRAAIVGRVIGPSRADSGARLRASAHAAAPCSPPPPPLSIPTTSASHTSHLAPPRALVAAADVACACHSLAFADLSRASAPRSAFARGAPPARAAACSSLTRQARQCWDVRHFRRKPLRLRRRSRCSRCRAVAAVAEPLQPRCAVRLISRPGCRRSPKRTCSPGRLLFAKLGTLSCRRAF